MLTEFADAVVDRFMDPSLHHQLASILMNCTSKVKARVIPSILDARSAGTHPVKLYFALAAFFALYRNSDGTSPVTVTRAEGKTGQFQDDEYAVKAMAKAWSLYKDTEESALDTVKAVLSDSELWGEDLSSKLDIRKIAKLIHKVVTQGIKATMSEC
jgi:tagaturonate reductase